jgi:hypothetical protein
VTPRVRPGPLRWVWYALDGRPAQPVLGVDTARRDAHDPAAAAFRAGHPAGAAQRARDTEHAGERAVASRRCAARYRSGDE